MAALPGNTLECHLGAGEGGFLIHSSNGGQMESRALYHPDVRKPCPEKHTWRKEMSSMCSDPHPRVQLSHLA